MQIKIFKIKSALTARIIYKNLNNFLNRLDKSRGVTPAVRQFIKIVVKISYKTGVRSSGSATRFISIT